MPLRRENENVSAVHGDVFTVGAGRLINEIILNNSLAIPVISIIICNFAAKFKQIHQKNMAQEDVFKKIVSHCKEYGYVFPSSEIYDGLGAVYDYGQMGVELKNNIKQYWWKAMTMLHENIVGIDSAIFMHPTIWKASGHVTHSTTPSSTTATRRSAIAPTCSSRTR